MTGRENRKARREAERKTRKLEAKGAPPTAQEQPAPSAAAIAAARLAAQRTESDRELEVEFGKDFVAHARATGPRTREGKLASSRNSLKHGLSTGALLIPGEDAAAFEVLRAALHREHQPADVTEQLLVDDLAQSHWLRQRAIRFQNDCFTAEGAINEKRLALFLRYGVTHERAFHKALTALLRLQKERRKSAQPIPSRRPNHFVSQTTLATPQFVSQNTAAPQLSTPSFHGNPSSAAPDHEKSRPQAA